ncbi:MAG: hypothetical protein IPK17_21640 [Chloroflexi bacterium]|uniref:hypothetical protein n=1 Tax=Candidatus Flexifilum breve TaxID=3140694 RepID=UPI003135083D|nr:hypothetical protein [Chloroflexota bacterium]
MPGMDMGGMSMGDATAEPMHDMGHMDEATAEPMAMDATEEAGARPRRGRRAVRREHCRCVGASEHCGAPNSAA